MILSRMALLLARSYTNQAATRSGVFRSRGHYRAESRGGDDATALRLAGGARPAGGSRDLTGGAGAMLLAGAVLGRDPMGMPEPFAVSGGDARSRREPILALDADFGRIELALLRLAAEVVPPRPSGGS